MNVKDASKYLKLKYMKRTVGTMNTFNMVCVRIALINWMKNKHDNITLKNYYYILENEARRLGYRVSYYASVNKACHHPNYVIFVKKLEDINSVYSFAHEIGHCIEFKKGDLDFNRYKNDMGYRQYKESAAWLLGYKVCLQLGIPVNGYWEHAYFCYKSYMEE